ncbi:hypothetical protein NUACC21_67260 [Scytonema sp. NUACC21]
MVVPIFNRLPQDRKFMLGDRIIGGLYNLLNNLIEVKYASNKRLFGRIEIENTSSQKSII